MAWSSKHHVQREDVIKEVHFLLKSTPTNSINDHHRIPKYQSGVLFLIRMPLVRILWKKMILQIYGSIPCVVILRGYHVCQNGHSVWLFQVLRIATSATNFRRSQGNYHSRSLSKDERHMVQRIMNNFTERLKQCIYNTVGHLTVVLFKGH